MIKEILEVFNIISFEISKTIVSTTPRKLKVRYNQEIANDLRQMHGFVVDETYINIMDDLKEKKHIFKRMKNREKVRQTITAILQHYGVESIEEFNYKYEEDLMEYIIESKNDI